MNAFLHTGVRSEHSDLLLFLWLAAAEVGSHVVQLRVLSLDVPVHF